MRRLEVAPAAQRDIDDILTFSGWRFGGTTAERYRALIFAAFEDLRLSPPRPGVRQNPALSPELRVYHLRHSRARVPTSERIGRPRHVSVFRADEATLEIVRLLHDSMDIEAHLP